jgi:lysozyme
MTKLQEWIKKCEGFHPNPYLDMSGKLRIGFGREITYEGITIAEAEMMFNNDFARCQKELYPHVWFMHQPLNVQFALINMWFSLGILRLTSFKKMIAAINEKNYTQASLEVLDSKWALQVGDRAKQVAVMIREGF